jgi:hypothetical protein
VSRVGGRVAGHPPIVIRTDLLIERQATGAVEQRQTWVAALAWKMISVVVVLPASLARGRLMGVLPSSLLLMT